MTAQMQQAYSQHSTVYHPPLSRRGFLQGMGALAVSIPRVPAVSAHPQMPWADRGLGDVKAISVPLPSGDAGIAKTIQWMKRAATEAARDPVIRAQALQITNGVGNRDSSGEVQAVYNWVKSNIAFRGEYDETVQTPEVTLKFRAGDCDDHSSLICGLLGSLGYDCRFSTVAVHGEKEFTHVYAEVQDRATGQWVALDTTMPEATPGWEPSGISRKKAWKALGYLARGPAPMRAYTPNWMRARVSFRGLGNGAIDQITQDVNAARPLVNAFADISAQDYRDAPYGPIAPYIPFQPVTAPANSVSPWLIGGVLVVGTLVLSRSRKESRR